MSLKEALGSAGAILGKFKGILLIAMGKLAIYTFVPILTLSIFTTVSKEDRNIAKANEIKIISKEVAQKFYHIEGNNQTGYYYEFNNNIDEIVDELINDGNNKHGEFVFDNTEEDRQLIKKMLKAEVVTYLPDLGGAPNLENDGQAITGVDDLLKSMTVEQKVRQMIIAIEEYAGTKDSIEIPQVGGYVFNGTGEGVTPLINENKAKYNNSSPDTITPFYSADDEGGKVNRFLSGYPMQRDYTGGLGSGVTQLDSEKLKADYAKKVPELKEAGVNLLLAPVADVSTDESEAIGAYGRSFGPNEDVVKEAVKLAVTTLKDNQMASTLKHYPGYGSIDKNPHEQAAEGEKITGPFVEGYKASEGTSAVMVGHFSYEGEGVPATLSRKVLDGLRQEMGNDVLTITDSMNMGSVALNGMDAKRRFVEAVDAGMDMVMPEETQVEDAVNGIMEAIQDKDQATGSTTNSSPSATNVDLTMGDGKLYMKQIDDAVRRILNFKEKNGILDFSNMSGGAGGTAVGDAGGQDGYAIYPIPTYNTPELRGQNINQVWGHYSYGGSHGGTDINYLGLDLYPFPELYCAFPGTVTEAGFKEGNGLGCHVTIKADGTYNGTEVYFSYGHMSRACVTEGQHVQDGDFIGYGGTTGRSDGPHLHYEINEGHIGNQVDPYEYFPPGYVGSSSYGATSTGKKQIKDASGNPIKITGQYRKPASNDQLVNSENSQDYGGLERLNPGVQWVQPIGGSSGTTTATTSGGASTTATVGAGSWEWPIEGMTDPHERREMITSNFGLRDAPTAGASSNHPAIDIGVSDGTHVIAAGGGTVVSAGDAGGYGIQVVIDHGTVNGHHVQTCYSHLSGFHVNVGDTVQKGQYIADSGHSRNRYRSSLRF